MEDGIYGVQYHHHHSSPVRFVDQNQTMTSMHDDDDLHALIARIPRSDHNQQQNATATTTSNTTASIKAKISAHPRYPRLLDAYIDCQKVGAPPEIASLMEEIRRDEVSTRTTDWGLLGADPELDLFMETYCDVLSKYKSDLSRPFDEATSFITTMELQLADLCNTTGASKSNTADDAEGSSEDEFSGGEMEAQDSQVRDEDRDIKEKLLRKYSGYLSSLKQKFSKKKKKGKLPKEARQTLLDWWTVHYKWPYPTETDKTTLAELTGLDQKQINNWFINQRKRHWKPSESMQVAVMDSLSAPYYG